MFQFPSLASGTYVFSDGSRGFAAGGFPIRKSPGQSLLGGSPELIAACHVLHRLLTPGHPPCALVRLTTTQRMKEFRTAHSESVVKEQEREYFAPKSKKLYPTFALRASWLAKPKPEGNRFSQPASALRGCISPSLRSYGGAAFALRAKAGGGERDRTDGLLVANQALSQLSYTPARQPTSPAARVSVDPGTPEMRGGPR